MSKPETILFGKVRLSGKGPICDIEFAYKEGYRIPLCVETENFKAETAPAATFTGPVRVECQDSGTDITVSGESIELYFLEEKLVLKVKNE